LSISLPFRLSGQAFFSIADFRMLENGDLLIDYTSNVNTT